jgi:phospholysine phosphohistidine inorganic pyrophosphate phosphatase
MSADRPKAVLIDLDGTLYVGGEALPGTVEAVGRLRRAGIALRVLTNTTRRSRRSLLGKVGALGFDFTREEILNAPAGAARWIRSQGWRSVLPLLARDAWEDLEDLEVLPPGAAGAAAPVDAVLVGDLGSELRYRLLNEAFLALDRGAALVACQKNRYWKGPDGLLLDAGPVVAALEFASGKEAVVVGKPNAAFFHSALRGTGAEPGEAVMAGDDIEADVEGARRAGLRAALVRTGKFRPGDLDGRPDPDFVLDSFADLPGALGL